MLLSFQKKSQPESWRMCSSSPLSIVNCLHNHVSGRPPETKPLLDVEWQNAFAAVYQNLLYQPACQQFSSLKGGNVSVFALLARCWSLSTVEPPPVRLNF